LFLSVFLVQFSSFKFIDRGLSSAGQLLNEHSNARMHKYADSAQLFDKGRKSREKLQNIIKMIKVSYRN